LLEKGLTSGTKKAGSATEFRERLKSQG
jgi:hypothetical protein